MAFNGDDNPIFDCGKFKPMRSRVFRTTEDGKPVTRAERRPQGKYLMVIDHYGNELPLKIHNAISEQAVHDPYGIWIKQNKFRRNHEWNTDPMIPSTMCPQQTEHEFLLPHNLRTGQRCSLAADGHPIGEARDGSIHWCKCIAALVKDRVAANQEVEQARDPRTTIMEATLNNSQEMNQKLARLLENMVESGAIAPEPKKGKTPKAEQ